jgi:hypothetical protein
MMTKSEALAAIASSETLIGTRRSDYPGMEVEYRPRRDAANGHPDAYAWHVKGRPDFARLRASDLEIK